jgi:diguanylate cyclase (GGDEF)-like protein
MTLTISSVIVATGYHIFRNTMEDYYISLGRNLVRTAIDVIDADALDAYLETGATDEAYDRTMQILRAIRRENSVLNLYVYKPAEEGSYFIYDASETEDVLDLGYLDPWDENYPEYKRDVLNGRVDPIISRTGFGWLLSVNEPILGPDGSVKGFVGADFSMDRVTSERMSYLLNTVSITLLITVVFALIYLYMIRRSIIIPINVMARAANGFLVGESQNTDKPRESSILCMDIATGDELQSLADAMKSMERKINGYLTNLNIVTIKSETDALTGLWNRETFKQRVTSHLRDAADSAQMDAFMMIDVDYFKSVNDTYGHAAGDEVLVKCSSALRNVLRDSDIIARQGGDEFVVFCKSIGNASTAENKARQIKEAWREVVPSGGDRGIAASIGISLYPRDGGTFQELFERADEALYATKESGRDHFEFYSEQKT